MSNMSELYIIIEEMLDDEIAPTRIAKTLDIPLSMVIDVLQTLCENEYQKFDNKSQT